MISISISTIVFALGLVLGASAQSTSDVCSNFTVLIDSLEALESAQACTTITGDVVIEYSADFPSEIEFPLLEEVSGSFLSLNYDEDILVSRLAAPNLQRVLSDFYISHWVNLSTIDMPMFDQTNRIRLNDLPSLTSANFLSTVRSIENNYEVWNTSLTNITNDRLNYAAFVEIFDNPNLETLELTALQNASYNIALRRNRPGMNVRLSSLTEVWYFELQHIASLFVPVLESAIGHFIVNASSLESLSAPKLRTIGVWYDPHIVVTNNVGLVVTNNNQLNSISLPELETVRLDLIVRNNSALSELSLPALNRVAGNVALEGTFTQVNFTGLDRVGGEFTIGTDQSTVCNSFQTLKDDGGIRGSFSCPTFSEPPSDADTSSEDYIEDFLAWANSDTQNNSGGDSSAAARRSLPGLKEIMAVCLGLGLVLNAL